MLILSVTPLGVGVVIALGSVLALALALDRPQDAALTGITSVVVLVVADLGQPSAEWEQPLLRLLDTAIGIAVGLLAAALTARPSPRRLTHPEGNWS